MKAFHSFTVLIIVSFIFAACKKDSTSTGGNGSDIFSTCRLTERTDSTQNKTEYQYDSKGRLAYRIYINSVGDTTGIDTFNYVGSTMVGRAGTFDLNSNGDAIKMHYDPIILDLTYNDQGQLTSIADVTNGFHSTYTWKDGNMVTETATSTTTVTIENTYYMDKVNIFALTDRLQSFTGAQNKNLLKSVKETNGRNVTVTNYTYEFDAQGKVTRRICDGANPVNYTCKWNCR